MTWEQAMMGVIQNLNDIEGGKIKSGNENMDILSLFDGFEGKLGICIC